MRDDEDAADIFDTALSTIFDVRPIALSSSADGTVTYAPPPLYAHVVGDSSLSNPTASAKLVPRAQPVRLRLPQPPASLHIALQANYLWLSAVYLADLISAGHLDVRGRRAAELGAGAGLPGIMACRNGADVVSSDWPAEEVLDVLRANFLSNTLPEADTAGRWEVLGHRWGTDTTHLLAALAEKPTPFHNVFLADTLWSTDAHESLLDSVFALLAPSGSAHIVAGLHTGRGPIKRFIRAAEKRGAIVSREAEMSWNADGAWSKHEEGADDSRSDGMEEERGVVVHYTLQIHT